MEQKRQSVVCVVTAAGWVEKECLLRSIFLSYSSREQQCEQQHMDVQGY